MKLQTIFPAVLLLLVTASGLFAQRPDTDRIEASEGPVTIQPVRHGTLVLSWNGITIYADPAGGAGAFQGIDSPDLVLITDIHGDHLSLETLNGLNTGSSVLVVPRAVAKRLPESYEDRLVILENGESTEAKGVMIRAIPMYNLPETEDSRHPKGRGNGYILTLGGKRFYLSGDTEDIPEMRSLKNIDVAFVCMNLPYTMDVNQAASAVLEFQPEVVYPYHYRGQDTEKFRELVQAKNGNIEVRLRDWYMGGN